jgi:hypothetical protein
MKSKRRALFLLVVFGSLLALAAAWDLPDDNYDRAAELPAL